MTMGFPGLITYNTAILYLQPLKECYNRLLKSQLKYGLWGNNMTTVDSLNREFPSTKVS